MSGPEQTTNLIALFEAAVARRGESPFLWAKHDGAYQSWSWSRVAAEARALAATLARHGVAPGDRVALVAENRPEWVITDLAVMMAGGVTVPAFATYHVDDLTHVIAHSGAKAAIVSTPALVGKVTGRLRDMPELRLLVTMAPVAEIGATDLPTLDWRSATTAAEPLPYDAARALTRDDLACLIYTSGTGGRPKGVMLSHGNILTNVDGAYHLLEALGLDDEVFLSFLPLSHAYEHTAGLYVPIAIAAQIYYAEGVETLSSNLVEVKPTIMTCVPRLYEVMRHRILGAVRREGGTKAKMFMQAVEIGRKRYEGEALTLSERVLDPALERLVRGKVRERFGGRLKALVSGGAALNYDVGLFFTALGLPVLQGYGQSEASPVISCNVPGRSRLHTVGPPLRGVEVKIADDGEILARGAMVMQGYWRDPELSAATVRDGWLHTGDIGKLDEHGYLQITDRKKDIIVNSGGDNIAPQRVEGILTLQPEIAQAVVFGDRRPHLVALLAPQVDFVKRFAEEHGLPNDLPTLADNAAFQGAIGEAVQRANERLSAIEKVRRFHVLAEPFTVDAGLMTPTMKLRRAAIFNAYQREIEGLYGGAKQAGAA